LGLDDSAIGLGNGGEDAALDRAVNSLDFLNFWTGGC
jgi:hypothetical protein